MEKIKVVKIGGNVIDNPEALRRFAADFAAMPGPKVLVHGGGKEATRMSERMGMTAQMIDGRRVTDAATLEIVTMVYAGLINKRIVELLQAAGCNAIGLTGADGNAIRAVRRKPNPIDYGFVGDITEVNYELFASLIAMGLTPVVCAIMHDGQGLLLNCNADSVASAVATGLAKTAAVDLLFCFEKAGVLRDIDDPTSVIGRIDRASYTDLRAEGVIAKGMIPKIDNALAAVDMGVESVVIRPSDNLLLDCGTTITK